MFYHNVTINAYDADGGLWFSRSFTGSHQELESVVMKATENEEVVEIRIKF